MFSLKFQHKPFFAERKIMYAAVFYSQGVLCRTRPGAGCFTYQEHPVSNTLTSVSFQQQQLGLRSESNHLFFALKASTYLSF